MELTRNILLILHLAGMAGILISLLASRTKLSAGVTHSALLSFITGLALVGIRYPLVDADPVKWEAIDHVKISLKLIIVLAILIIAYVNKKKTSLSPMVLPWLGGLAISNIIIAYVW
jgi:hypothetical protein